MTFTHVECSDSGIWKGYVDIRGLNVDIEILKEIVRVMNFDVILKYRKELVY